jgi:hypothetical protein
MARPRWVHSGGRPYDELDFGKTRVYDELDADGHETELERTRQAAERGDVIRRFAGAVLRRKSLR